MTEEEKDETNENDLPEKRHFEEELLKIIKSDDPPERIKEELNDYHENDIAAILPNLSKQERIKLYKILGTERVSDVFSYLDNVEAYIGEIDNEKAADIIESMDADDAVDVLDELDDSKKNDIINLMEQGSVEDIKLIDSYDEDMIGSKMTTNYVFFNKNLSVKQAMKSVIDQAAENDNITTIYAVNDDKTFYGAIELRDLIIAREGTPLEDIISTSYPYIYAKETIEECIEKLKDYSEDSIPVLRKNNVLIGVITSSDIVEVVDEEMSDDYAKFAGLTEEEDLNEPLRKSMRKRIPWLLILLVLGLVVSSVIQLFQRHLPTGLIVLYTFQSLILDMSGNTGTQSLGVTIRLLSNDSLDRKSVWKFVLKELKVGLCNGLLIGTLACVSVGLYLTFLTSYTKTTGIPYYGFEISACIGLSLICAMVIASLTGTLIPMFFKKIGIDPAVASGPLITTVNDFIAVCTYYGISLILFVQIGVFVF